MRTTSFLALGAIAAAAVAACYVGPVEREQAPTSEPSPTDPDDNGGEPGAAPGTQAANGLPCDVDALLASKCRSCHGTADSTKAPMALVTYEDLTAKAKSDGSKTVAELSLARMTATDEPMPPRGAKATASELSAFEGWLEAGTPRGECEPPAAEKDAGSTSNAKSDAAAPPPDAGVAAASVCTSATTWTSTEKSSRMNPGRACIGCHTSLTGQPILQIAGTVYPSLHEPDRCYGATNAYVVVTDATGRTVTLPTGSTGNFTLSASVAALVHPIKVRVVKNGIARAMVGSPPHGDCNACHTEAGANGAPGRILLP